MLEKTSKNPLFADVMLEALTIVLVGFGVLMVYSTTGIISQEKFGSAFYYVKRQGAAAVAGLVLMVLVSRVRITYLRKLAPFFLPVCLVLLALTMIPGVGARSGGAVRWISILGFRFQPGELVKVLFVIFMAGYLDRHQHRLSSFVSGIVKPVLLVGSVGVLLLAQPDFGTTAVLVLVTLAMATVAGVNLRYLAAGGIVVAVGMGILVLISPYRMSRIVSFMSPWQDASGKGYQLIQSLIAVGTGQVTGVGLGESQQKLFFLPAAHTDFIFAVIAEELGFIGAISVIICFLLFLWRGLRVSRRLTEDTFAFCLCVGLTLMVALPALLNIGVVIGVLPTKGLVLPLVGYGGSSLVSSLASIGLLLACARTAQTRR